MMIDQNKDALGALRAWKKGIARGATKVCIMLLDGLALASVRVARGLESVLGVGSEFVVFVLSVVRHVDINLARFATRGG